MFTIAHRGNTYGKSAYENELKHLLVAAALSNGIEIDIRRANNNSRLIISHNPADYHPSIDAQNVLDALGDTFIALNIKQEGLLNDLVLIKPEIVGFVFDFELCCAFPNTEMAAYKHAGYKVAKRYSDNGDLPHGEFDYIWLDEMISTNSLDVSTIDLNKTIYVSPELHGRSPFEHRNDQFWAVCTDFICLY